MMPWVAVSEPDRRVDGVAPVLAAAATAGRMAGGRSGEDVQRSFGCCAGSRPTFVTLKSTMDGLQPAWSLSMRASLIIGVWTVFASTSSIPGALAQPAPSKNYETVEAMPGKPVRIGIYGSANRRDCSPLRAPTIRVIEAPSSGSLSVRLGEATTDKIAGCPTIKIPVQAIVYTAKADAVSDRVIFEVTNANGEVATHQIAVKIVPRAKTPGARTLEQKT